MSENRLVEDVHELVQLLELTDCRCYEISGRRREETQGESREGLGQSLANETVALEVKIGSDDTHLEVRLRGSLDRLDVEITADVSCIFTAGEPFKTSTAVRTEFAEKVGVMAVYPYLREAVSDVALRLGAPVPLLSLLRPGQVKLGAQAPE